MPHLVLEYSDNVLERIDAKALFSELHATLVGHGPFTLSDMKSRAVVHHQYCVGDGAPGNAFVHLTLSILSGRELQVKQAVGQRLLAVLMAAFARSYQELDCPISLEIRDLERETYFKSLAKEG